ncbi:MAG: hypothetical protein GF315_13070 [candidate division Zixibacteria bacterium]|nr:hypothetical protein [candidate division Zixibacteria bacterium]
MAHGKLIILFAIIFLTAGNLSAITITGNVLNTEFAPYIKQWANEVAVSGLGVFSGCIPDTVSVDIANTNEEFRRFSKGRLPDWGIGAADPSGKRIILKNPNRFSYAQGFGEVVKHEFAHIYLESCCPRCAWPRWFHEGCAMLFSGEWRVGRDVTVARALIFSDLPSLAELDNVNRFSQAKASLSYSLSYLAMRRFVDQFGRGGLNELFKHMNQGKSFEAAFYHSTGFHFDLWEVDFKEYLRDRYIFLFWFTDLPIFWTAMVVLFILAYLLKRRQAKKKAEEWEKTENYDYFDYGSSQD